MRILSCLGLLALTLTGWMFWIWTPPTPFRISKETTYILEPLTAEGHVDFVEAVNRSLRPCPLEENAFALIYQVVDWNEDAETYDLGLKLGEVLGLDVDDYVASPVLVSYEEYFKTRASEDADAAPAELPLSALTTPWSREESPLISDWVDSLEPALAVLSTAAQRPGFYRPVILGKDGLLLNAQLEDCQAYRVAVRGLCARAMRRCQADDMAGAVADVGLAYQIGHWSGEYPWLITQLVEFTIFAVTSRATHGLINSGKLSAESAADLQSKLERRFQFVPVNQIMDYSQRLLILQTYLEQHVYRDEPLQEKIAIVLGNGRWNWNIMLGEVNQLYDEAARISSIHDPETFSREYEVFRRQLVAATKDAALFVEGFVYGRDGVSRRMGQKAGALTLPKFDTNVRLRRRNLAERRLVVLALALIRYHDAHGRFPKELTELTSGYHSLTDDEMSGLPIEYAPTEDEAYLKVQGVNGKQPVGNVDAQSFTAIEVRIPAPHQK